MTTTVDALPSAPQRNQDRDTFQAKMQALLAALVVWRTQMTAVGSESTDAVAQAAAAAILALQNANNAAGVGGVTLWVSGTTYTRGAVVFSPSTYQTYRRKATGAGTTDPASDGANWTAITINPNGAQLSAPTVTGGMTVTGGATISGALAITGSLTEGSVTLSGNNIDMNAGKVFSKTITGATTLTVSNVPVAGKAGEVILRLTNAGTNMTFWAGIDWVGGTPTFSSSGTDVVFLFTTNGGTSWTGMVFGQGF